MLVLDVQVLGPRVLLVRGADLSWLSSYGVAKFFGDQVGPLVRKFDTSCLWWAFLAAEARFSLQVAAGHPC